MIFLHLLSVASGMYENVLALWPYLLNKTSIT